jgi:hypothetical protein
MQSRETSAEPTSVVLSDEVADLTAAGTINFTNVQIDGDFVLWGSSLTNTFGPALSARNLKVGGIAWLNPMTATADSRQQAAIKFSEATLESLYFDESTITNRSGSAVDFQNVTIGRGSFGFTAIANDSQNAAIRFADTKFDLLKMTDAHLTNERGTALEMRDVNNQPGVPERWLHRVRDQ